MPNYLIKIHDADVPESGQTRLDYLRRFTCEDLSVPIRIIDAARKEHERVRIY